MEPQTLPETVQKSFRIGVQKKTRKGAEKGPRRGQLEPPNPARNRAKAAPKRDSKSEPNPGGLLEGFWKAPGGPLGARGPGASPVRPRGCP